jgi:hypothetical protein
MTRLRGWAPRGERLADKVPQGKWKTATFLAALRNDRIDAPCLFDGPIMDGDEWPTICGTRRCTQFTRSSIACNVTLRSVSNRARAEIRVPSMAGQMDE